MAASSSAHEDGPLDYCIRKTPGIQCHKREQAGDCIERFHNPRIQRTLDVQDRAFSALNHPSAVRGKPRGGAMKYVQITFQVIRDDGTACCEQILKIPVEPCKHAPSRMLPALAEREAGRFWEYAIRKGALDESATSPAPTGRQVSSH